MCVEGVYRLTCYVYVPITDTQRKNAIDHPRRILQPFVLLEPSHDIVAQCVTLHLHFPASHLNRLLFIRFDGKDPQIFAHGVQTRHRPRPESSMAVPAYEQVRDFFPRLVDFNRPVIAVMARLGAEDLANGFPVGDIYVYPGDGFCFGKVRLLDTNVGLDVFLDGEDIRVFMEAAEKSRIMWRCDGGEGCCEMRAGA